MPAIALGFGKRHSKLIFFKLQEIKGKRGREEALCCSEGININSAFNLGNLLIMETF